MCSLMKLLHKPDTNVMLRKAELQYFLCIHKQLFHSQVAAPENLLKTCLSLSQVMYKHSEVFRYQTFQRCI